LAHVARDIAEEFTHRTWHQHVTCEWDGFRLVQLADNDFDASGLALLDEFSDAISAGVSGGFDGDIQIARITPLLGDAPKKVIPPPR
jgi:hypothetical protein